MATDFNSAEGDSMNLEELKRRRFKMPAEWTPAGQEASAEQFAMLEEFDRQFPAIVAKLEADQTALNDAAYALFQIKRMTPEAIPQFAADAHAKACKHLDHFPAFDKETA